ncbi:hypothetical protein JB92DRAFT_2902655 [Gautieria morchelliformis]|nr:hypothetical protein JB92DRAFT_2902655 [Gautieria morchelliformis]
MRMNRSLPVLSPQPTSPSAEILALRRNWKWAYLSHFLFTYNPVLHLEDIQLSELEDDLAAGTMDVIPTVMQRLLMSLTPHDKRMILENWQHQLRRQSLKRSPDHNLMGTEDDPTDFESLIMSDKLDLFQALCEWQFQNPNNLRTRMRDDDEYANWRMEPIAYDAKGNAYWLMGGNRLWIQYAPPRRRAAKSHKRKQPATASTNGRKSAKRKQTAASASTSGEIAIVSATQAKSKSSASPAIGGRPIRETRSRGQAVTERPSRTMGTRVSSRLRGREEEEIWQSIPEDWLKEVAENDAAKAENADQLSRKAKGKGTKVETEIALKSLDDMSELTSLSDLSEHPETEEEEMNEDDNEDSTRAPTPTPDFPSSPSYEDSWMTLCVTLADWESFPQRFEKSTNRAEKKFFNLLINDLVPAITEVLRVDVRKKVMEEAVVHRKRSSRIAVKESVREAERAEARRRAEEEKEMERHRRWEARARKEEEERVKRESMRSTRLREKDRTGSESADVDVVGGETETKPVLTNGTVLGQPTSVTPTPVKFVVNVSKSGTHTPKDDDPWELDCEICHRRGMNLDDGQELMCCERCNKWQHIRCHDQADFIAGRPRRNWELEDFLCTTCAATPRGSSSEQPPQWHHPDPPLWSRYGANIGNGVAPMPPQPAPPQPAYNQTSYDTAPHSNGRTNYASPRAQVQPAHSMPPTHYAHRSQSSAGTTGRSVFPESASPQSRAPAPTPAPAPPPVPSRAPYMSGPNMYLSNYPSSYRSPQTIANHAPQPSSSSHHRSTVPVTQTAAWSQQQLHYSQLASQQAWNGTAHTSGSQSYVGSGTSVGQPAQTNGYYRPRPTPLSNPLPPPNRLPSAPQHYTGGPSAPS